MPQIDDNRPRRLIAAHEVAMAEGKAVATFNGKMVEVLHVLEARRTLAVAQAIARMKASPAG